MSAPDPVAAVIALLKADASITSQVGSRIFGGELPQSEAISMPRSAIVVKSAGGGFMGSGYQEWHDVRLDLSCYAATPGAAHALYRAALPVLKHLERSEWAGCCLYWAKQSGGPVSMRSAETDWPLCFSSWQILVSEIAV